MFYRFSWNIFHTYETTMMTYEFMFIYEWKESGRVVLAQKSFGRTYGPAITHHTPTGIWPVHTCGVTIPKLKLHGRKENGEKQKTYIGWSDFGKIGWSKFPTICPRSCSTKFKSFLANVVRSWVSDTTCVWISHQNCRCAFICVCMFLTCSYLYAEAQ